MTQLRHMISGEDYARLQQLANKLRKEEPLTELEPGMIVRVHLLKYKYRTSDGRLSDRYTVSNVDGNFATLVQRTDHAHPRTFILERYYMTPVQ